MRRIMTISIVSKPAMAFATVVLLGFHVSAANDANYQQTVENWRHTSLATPSLGPGAEALGTRGDLPRGDGRAVDAHDGPRTGAGTEHSEP